jgi:hypothetical protein
VDHKKQFETMAVIRAYAELIAAESSIDCTEVRAKIYSDRISRMFELANSLETGKIRGATEHPLPLARIGS